MSLNLITNRTANIAHRNLVQSDMDMTQSLGKLSSGQRVVSAKDDAAAMSIGSRIKSDVAALRQIQVNTTQAVSLLQIAEGAQARIYDMLVRLKALASQAGSSSLSNTERSMLDTEYQALRTEIDRVAASTTFNGSTLVNANVTVNRYAGSHWSNLIDIAVGGVQTDTNSLQMNIQYGSGGGNYVVTAQGAGKTYAATLNTNLLNSSGQLLSGTALRLVSVTGALGSSATVSGDNSYVTLSYNAGMDLTTTVTGTNTSLGLGAGSTSTTFAFKVGIGSNASANQISLNLEGVNATAIGLANSNILSQAKADAAYAAVSIATDLILTFRASIGAGQSRMESTSQNVSVVIENMEAARSAYLDLDVAAEMSMFTNKQILQQAGVAMIAQANKLPENLLRLFQG